MRLWDDARAWGWPSRLLHWGMAGLILGMLGLGVWTANFVEDMYARYDLVQLHKSLGVVVFALALLRVGWRRANRARPEAPAGSSRLERAAAEGAHLALYALMLAMPLSGWLMASASELEDMFGMGTQVFGAFTLPDPFKPGDAALEAAFRTVHQGCAVALAALIALHGAAALVHHRVRRDDVLRRMTVGPRAAEAKAQPGPGRRSG